MDTSGSQPEQSPAERAPVSPRVIVETGLAHRVAQVVETVIEDVGYRLVWVRILGGADCTVRIMAETQDGVLGIDDCVKLTRVLSPLLDVEDPVPGGYTLEVSSPGIDRHLVRISDFERHAGATAKIELSQALGGRKRFRGILEGAQDGEVRLVVEDADFDTPQTIGLALSAIAEAKLAAPTDISQSPDQSGKQKAGQRAH
ncbi:MAG: ribosome maturation factor RimP [Alphaproteobacteria bacterium]